MDDQHMIDYELLGGLLGSAWRDHHPEQGYSASDRARAVNVVKSQIGVYEIGTVEEMNLTRSMIHTMNGECYSCGEKTTTRWSVGVYCCPVCAVRKARG